MSETMHDGGHGHHHGHGHQGLFGHLDQSQYSVPGANHSPLEPTSTWAILRKAKFSDLLQGINVTPNILFLFLFLGFIAWLGIIYWIRHNEPLANQVLGSHRGLGGHHADRHLVEGIKKSYPIQTPGITGEIFVPNKPVATHLQPAHPLFGQPNTGNGHHSYGQAQAASHPAPARQPATQPARHGAQLPSGTRGLGNTYLLANPHISGNSRLRMVVSR